MAKKRFTDGLDNLFGAPDEQPSETSLSLFPDKSTKGSAKRDDEKKSSKGFASQLDAFLADAFESVDTTESAEGQEQEQAAQKEGTKPRRTLKKKRRLTGLDLLIRQTTDTPPTQRLNLADKRRLTLAFDKVQLNELKAIAEKEGVFLKDLINQLIERYLQERDK